MTPQTQIRLMKEFPQINTDVAKDNYNCPH